MTVRANKPALSLREELTKAQSNNADEARIGSLVSDSIDAVAIDAETLTAGATVLSSTLSVASGITASSGVYLGGAVAANLLDDYEEGTWTPTNAGDATGTVTSAEGVYTKVGRLVTVEGVFTVSNNFTSNVIGGLPFVVTAHLTATGIAQSGRAITQTADDIQGFAFQGGSTVGFVNDGNGGSSHLPNTTNATYRISLTYQTA